MKSRSPGDKYRIIIADDHRILREGLRRLIEEAPDLEVVGEAGDGEQLLEQLRAHDCQLVLLDISMPKLDGLEALALIKKHYRKLKILILSMHASIDYFKKAMQKGADGYILKENAYDRLLWAIAEIRAGRKAQSPGIVAELVEEFVGQPADQVSLDLLSKREREVLAMVARGLTSKSIGEHLNISPRTVESHRARIMEKLGLKTTAEMIRFALAKKLS